MTGLRRLAAALLLVFALCGSASAAELFSPPMAPTIGQGLQCLITNVTDNLREVTIRIFGFREVNGVGVDGVLLATSPLHVLDSMQTASMSVDDLLTVTPHICSFTVQGGKGGYRASACAIEVSGSTPITCVPGE